MVGTQSGMNVKGRLNVLIEAAEEGPMVMVPVKWLRSLLTGESDSSVADRFDYLSVDEAAELVDRAASTVRTWCCASLIPGAKKLCGRQWIIPRAGLQSFLDGKSQGPDRSEQRRTRGAVDLSAWRKSQPAT